MLCLAAFAACKQTPAPAPAAPVDLCGDRIVVLAHHIRQKPTDPVVVEVRKFHVVRAHFDPAHPEGGTATIELDLASLHTDSDERDDDLRSPNFLDVGKFATATIDIDHVHARGGNAYTADANGRQPRDHEDVPGRVRGRAHERARDHDQGRARFLAPRLRHRQRSVTRRSATGRARAHDPARADAREHVTTGGRAYRSRIRSTARTSSSGYRARSP